MHRFRLLGFYVAGIVVVVGLTIGGVAMRRTADDHGAREASAEETAAPTTVNAESISVSINQFVFQPKELIVPAGTTVTWVNADDIPHTATSRAVPPLFDSKTLDKDDKFSFLFKVPGTYDYYCKLHPNMIGKVIVK